MKKTYLRFLSLVHALDNTTMSSLDETAKHLLQLIMLRYVKGQALTVTEAMSMSTVASPATIHRKLNVLLDAGLVTQVFEGNNRRTKYLTPTAAAETYFAELSDVMAKAALP
jgi:DNA-binding MarR family transcriptional regulator